MKLRKISSKKKFLIWTTLITLIIVILAVYETKKEMQKIKEQQNSTSSNNLASRVIPIEKAASVVRKYYRSHDLPIGWKLGKTDVVDSDTIEVAIIFSPRIGDSRHGKSADPDEMNYNNACPLDNNVKNIVTQSDLFISINDKTGLIKKLFCQ